jgi:hypothetical protein
VEAAPEAEAPSAAPADTGAVPELDDVIEAWPAALDDLRPPVRATIQEAQPIGIERGAIVFGAPPTRLEAINARFRSEAPAIKAALAARLGFEPKIMVRAHDFESVDALKPTSKGESSGGARADEPPTEDHEDIDLDELTDAPDVPPPDPAARLMEGLGAQVVEEHSRD